MVTTQIARTRRPPRMSCSLVLAGLAAIAGGCGPEEPPRAPAARPGSILTARAPAETASARAERIARVQADASADYDVTDVGGILKTHNRAQRFDAEFADRVELRFAGGDHLAVSLQAYGCDGELEQTRGGSPHGTGNRVEYRREGVRSGDAPTEWYVHGPLGLEQGFTLETPLGCGGRDSVIEVALGGTLSPMMARGGQRVLLRSGHGTAVAAYGDLHVADATGRQLRSRLEVGVGSVRIWFDESDAVHPVRVDPLIGIEQAKLVSTEAEAYYDELGTSVALWGDTALTIGDKGPVYLFERAEGVWAAPASLTSNDPTYMYTFGSSIAISEDTILVGAGAVYVDEFTTHPGLVDVLVRSNGQWTYEASLQAADGLPYRTFGDAVAVWGDTAVVGSPTDVYTIPSGSGSVFVFTRSAGTWTQQAMLVTSTGSFLDLFGRSVAISGDTLVVGAMQDDDKGVDAGSAYVFEREGDVWTERVKLFGDDTVGGDDLGTSVAIAGDTIIVGAPGHSDVREDSGAAYVFVRTAARTWTQQAELVASTGSNATGLGSSVALEGDAAVVGAAYDSSEATYAGAAYIFTRTGTTWTEQSKLVASDGAQLDHFGYSLAMSSSSVLVGAPKDDDEALGVSGENRGSAYVFALTLTYGEPCIDDEDCVSGFCVDGVCCDSPCDSGPCDACSRALGATADGTCTALTTCDDGNACTLVDVCEGSECVGAEEVVCPPVDDCHSAGICDPRSGSCDNPPLPDGTPCTKGTCLRGQCESREEHESSSGDVRVVGGCDCGIAQGDRPDGFLIGLLLGLTGAIGSLRRSRSGRCRSRGACRSRC